jgi:hypothetical protein
MQKLRLRRKDYTIVGHTLVDDEDFEHLDRWAWRLAHKGYAGRRENGKLISLHNVVAELAGMDMTNTIDHISRDKLDNRRSNLRPATAQQQNWNQGIRTNNTSGVTGVDWIARQRKWRARIRINGKNLHLGLFDDLQDAKRARRAAELEHFEEFTPTMERP